LNPLPYTKAEILLNSYSIKSPHYNLEEIANAEGLIVEEDDLSNHLGRISFSSAYGLIKIDNKIKDTGQKRFTLAHEMGHYFNERNDLTPNPSPYKDEGNKLKVYNCNYDDIFAFKISKSREDNANNFAAELLMHKPWFSKYIKDRKINFELIKDISSEFSVSLTAAAIRYANIGKYPVAVIFSKEGHVAWSYKSDYFPFKWIPKGYKVRRESAAYDFFASLGVRRDLTLSPSPYKGEGNDPTPRLAHGQAYKRERSEMQTCADLMPACVWFAEDSRCREDVYLYEQNVPMPKYNSVLTLLWESEFG